MAPGRAGGMGRAGGVGGRAGAALGVVLAAAALGGPAGASAAAAAQAGAGPGAGAGFTAALAKWLADSGEGAGIHAGLEPAAFPGMGAGYRVAEGSSGFAKGDILLRVPLGAVMSPKTAAEDAPALAQALLRRNASSSLQLTAHVLLEAARGKTSRWAPYLETLPRDYDLPLLWDPAEAENLLEGTTLLQTVQTQRRTADREFSVLTEAVADIKAANPDYSLPDSFLEEGRFMWALATVLSRSFSVNVENTLVPILVPAADVFNTGLEGSELSLDDTGAAVQVVSGKDYSGGDQVFLQLGPQGNSELMARQGFAFADNPHNTVNMFVSTPDSDPFTTTRMGIMRFLGMDPGNTHVLRRGRGLEKSLLQALRVSTLSPASFDQYRRLADGNPVSLENERDTLRQVMAACKVFLDKQPTSLEDDEKLLRRREGLPRRQAWAVLYRWGEKATYRDIMNGVLESWQSYLLERVPGLD